MVDRRLFQLVAVPVFGPDAIGFLVLGQAIDDVLAVRPANTGSDISFPLAHACSHRLANANTGSIVAGPGPADTRASERCSRTLLLTLDGERILSLIVPLDDRPLQPLYALRVLRCRAGPATYAAWRIGLVGGGCAAQHAGGRNCAFGGSITEPVKALVAGMREVLAGNSTTASGSNARMRSAS